MVTNDGRFESDGRSINDPVSGSLSWGKIQPLLTNIESTKKGIDNAYEIRYWFLCPQVILFILFVAFAVAALKALSDGACSSSDFTCVLKLISPLVIIVVIFFAIGSLQRYTRRSIRSKSQCNDSNVNSVRKEQNSMNSDLSDSQTDDVDNWISRLDIASGLNPSPLFIELINTFAALLKLGGGRPKSNSAKVSEIGIDDEVVTRRP